MDRVPFVCIMLLMWWATSSSRSQRQKQLARQLLAVSYLFVYIFLFRHMKRRNFQIGSTLGTFDHLPKQTANNCFYFGDSQLLTVICYIKISHGNFSKICFSLKRMPSIRIFFGKYISVRVQLPTLCTSTDESKWPASIQE